jgi:hypothetical protein
LRLPTRSRLSFAIDVWLYRAAIVTVLDAVPPMSTTNGTALPVDALAGTRAFTW